MVRLVLFLLAIVAVTVGLHFLAEEPGTLTIVWLDRRYETSMFRAVVLLGLLVAAAVLGWSILRQLWKSPASIGRLVSRRRERRGLDAISSGMIAIGSGDRALATRAAIQARKSLPNEPLTHLLRAQAAQLQGDGSTARRIFEAMLASPDTEQLGLRGLFLEADRVGEEEAARQFAERAMRLNPKLEWPVARLFALQCKARDWDGALATLAAARQHGHIDKKDAERRRAVLLTAQAQEDEEANSEKALTLASEAHGLAPDLIPAAAIAGRILASRGQTPKAARIIQRTWKLAPHPDLATAYAYARPGDSPSDRCQRVRQLAAQNAASEEGPIALAAAAIEARDWQTAEDALAPLLHSRLSQRVCTLMARIAGEGQGNTGKVREWLARAVNAPRDPAWTADGIVAEDWAPISPVTGQLDAFQWRVPLEAAVKPEAELIAARMEELVTLGTGAEPRLEAPVRQPREHAVDDAVTAEVVEPTRAQPAPPPAPDATAQRPQPGADAKSTIGNGAAQGPQPARGARSAAAKAVDAFITPHAPDDPGPEPTDADGDRKPARPNVAA